MTDDDVSEIWMQTCTTVTAPVRRTRTSTLLPNCSRYDNINWRGVVPKVKLLFYIKMLFFLWNYK